MAATFWKSVITSTGICKATTKQTKHTVRVVLAKDAKMRITSPSTAHAHTLTVRSHARANTVVGSAMHVQTP